MSSPANSSANVPTKILFLDIDGVLNSHRTAHVHGGPSEFGGVPRGGGFPHSFTPDNLKKFDHVAVGLVRQLCIETNCSIVLSSSWRVMHTVQDCANGLDLPIFDKTPSLAANRGSEIQHWLNLHPEVEVYAIVDDDSDMLESQKPYFVQTDGREGLLYRDFMALLNIMQGRPGGHSHNAIFWEDDET
jgi:HAD domain in Swiss Army Knife RNA repair proteins